MTAPRLEWVMWEKMVDFFPTREWGSAQDCLLKAHKFAPNIYCGAFDGHGIGGL